MKLFLLSLAAAAVLAGLWLTVAGEIQSKLAGGCYFCDALSEVAR